MSEHHFTLGIEEEYAIVDPKTRELKSHINTMLRQGKKGSRTRLVGENLLFQPELHQSVVEVATPVCRSMDDARRDILALRRRVIEKAESTGARIAAVGTHPFSDWKDQRITNRVPECHRRYEQMEEGDHDDRRADGP